jgi:predicted transcriptional regulator
LENIVDNEDLVALTADIVNAMVSNNTVAAADLPRLIQSVHASLSALGNEEPVVDAAPEYQGVVTARKSLANPAHILSMINGKPFKTLKKHLAVNGMTPDEYRERYGLKADYPMVSPAYAEMRKALAKKIGLGRKAGQTNAVRAAAKKAPSRAAKFITKATPARAAIKRTAPKPA